MSESEREGEREREREREGEVILYIQIHKHVHREYEQRDTKTEREGKKKHTRETHTHNVNAYTTQISLHRCVRGTLIDLKLERGSINALLGFYECSFRALLFFLSPERDDNGNLCSPTPDWSCATLGFVRGNFRFCVVVSW